MMDADNRCTCPTDPKSTDYPCDFCVRLEETRKQVRKEIEPLLKANRDSANITAKDLAITINAGKITARPEKT